MLNAFQAMIKQEKNDPFAHVYQVISEIHWPTVHAVNVNQMVNVPKVVLVLIIPVSIHVLANADQVRFVKLVVIWPSAVALLVKLEMHLYLADNHVAILWPDIRRKSKTPTTETNDNNILFSFLVHRFQFFLNGIRLFNWIHNTSYVTITKYHYTLGKNNVLNKWKKTKVFKN